jgi:hypothetical protein
LIPEGTVTKVSISHEVLARAKELGVHMAKHDIILRPRVTEAGQYETYHRFRISHRAHWEESSHFERTYQDQILRLAEKETRRNGLSEYDNMAHWDMSYNRIVGPLREAFWEAWEKYVGLERRYYMARLSTIKGNPNALKHLLSMSDALEAEEAEAMAATAPVLAPVAGNRSGFFAWMGISRKSA